MPPAGTQAGTEAGTEAGTGGAGGPGGPPLLRVERLRGSRVGPFDLRLAPGECLAVTGPSGAGKSLLLRMLADLDPHEGEAWLRGTARAALSGPEWRRAVRYAAAEPGWWTETVGAHFTAFPAVDAVRLGLRPGIEAEPVSACSTGERARLALLRALDDAPAVLLLDEPTGALDAAATAAVEELLRERLRAGVAVVLVTHDEAQAERLGTHRLRVEGGRAR